MSVTVYTLGDPHVLRSALEGLAMIFGNGSYFTSSATTFGLGKIAGIGLLVSLTAVLFNGVLKQRMDVHHVLVMAVIYALAFVPTETVVIENIYAGNGGVVNPVPVAGVPVAVAYTAAFASGVSKEITEQLETSFSAATNETSVLTEDGFGRPLRLMLAMRDIGTKGISGIGEDFRQTMSDFGRNCTSDSNGNSLDFTALGRSKNVLDFLASSSVVAYTQIWDASAGYPYPGSGKVDTCVNAANHLRTKGAAWLGDSTEKGFGFKLGTLAGSKPNCGSSCQVSYSDAKSALQQITAGITIANADVMQNLVFSPLVTRALKQGSLNTQDSTYLVSLNEAMDKWRLDSAGEAEMFRSTMIYTMNICTFMFVAFAPVMAVVMIMMGINGLGIFAKYLMFGVWVYSWLPGAAIVNFYIQTSIQDRITDMAVGMTDPTALFTPEAMYSFYEAVATNLATANTMFAATPVITMMFLTGSMYGMGQLAQKAGGNGAGYYDEKKAAPDIEKATNSDGLVSAALKAGHSTAALASAINGAGQFGMSNTGFDQSAAGTFSVGSAATAAVGAAKSLGAQAMKMNESARTESYRFMKQLADKFGFTASQSGGETHSAGNSRDLLKALGMDASKVSKLSDSEIDSVAKAVVATAGASFGFKIPGTEIGGKVGASAEAKAMTQSQQQIANELAATLKNSITGQDKEGSSRLRTLTQGVDTKEGKEGSLTKAYDNAVSTAKKAALSDTLSQSAENKVGGMDSAAMNLSVNLSDLARDVQLKGFGGSAQGALDGMRTMIQQRAAEGGVSAAPMLKMLDDSIQHATNAGTGASGALNTFAAKLGREAGDVNGSTLSRSVLADMADRGGYAPMADALRELAQIDKQMMAITGGTNPNDIKTLGSLNNNVGREVTAQLGQDGAAVKAGSAAVTAGQKAVQKQMTEIKADNVKLMEESNSVPAAATAAAVSAMPDALKDAATDQHKDFDTNKPVQHDGGKVAHPVSSTPRPAKPSPAMGQKKYVKAMMDTLPKPPKGPGSVDPSYIARDKKKQGE